MPQKKKLKLVHTNRMTTQSMKDALAFIETSSNRIHSIALLPPPLDHGDVTDDEEVDDQTLGDDRIKDCSGELEVELYDEDDGSGKSKVGGEDTNLFQLQTVNDCRDELLKLNPELVSMSVEDLLVRFITGEFVTYCSKSSNQYAVRKTGESMKITDDEIRVFFGILLLSGINVLPMQRNYWSKDPLLGNEFVKNTMTRARFEQIKTNFHLVDYKKVDTMDRWYKIAFMLEHVNSTIKQFGSWSNVFSIDECMVPSRFKVGLIQFMPLKPTRFGYKLFMTRIKF